MALQAAQANDTFGFVAALGATQIIGYGTLYYSYALIAPAAAEEFAVRPSILFGVFSIGLLVSGFLAPRIGRLLDEQGPLRLMTFGSLCAAAALGALAFAPGVVSFSLTVIALEIIGLAVLYDAAFAAIAASKGRDARRTITLLTLVAGFASTIFWPLTGWLVGEVGWRLTCFVFALLHLLAALPLHVLLARRAAVGGARAQGAPADAPAFTPLALANAPAAFAALAVSFALTGFVISASSVHMVQILQTAGLGASATLVAMLLGPAQVLSRIIEASAGARFHPVWTAIVSAAAIALSMTILLLDVPAMMAGIAFAVLSGVGQGLSSIVRGTLPLALFGPGGFGGLLGRLTIVRTTLSAGAPFLYALGVERLGPAATHGLCIAIGMLALAPLCWLMVLIRKPSR
jgi:MFS family permease